MKGTRYPGSVDLCLTRGGFSLSNCRSQGRPITFGYRVKSLSPAACLTGRERKAIDQSRLGVDILLSLKVWIRYPLSLLELPFVSGG